MSRQKPCEKANKDLERIYAATLYERIAYYFAELCLFSLSTILLQSKF